MDIERIRTVIAEMTLAEKLELCGVGANLVTAQIARLKINSVKLPSSIMAESHVMTPLGCSFSEELCEEYGKILSAEALIKGEALAGVVNLGVIRDPMSSGAELRLSEEPMVVTQLMDKVIENSPIKLIGEGMLAGEYTFSERNIDNRNLMEIYMKPFVRLGKKLGGVIIPAGSINGEIAGQSKGFMQLICDYTDSLALIINEFGSCISKPSAVLAGSGFTVPNNGHDNHEVARAVKDGHLFERKIDINLERLVNLVATYSEFTKQPPPEIELDVDFETKLCDNSAVLCKNMAVLPFSPSSDICVFGDISKAESLYLAEYFTVSYKKQTCDKCVIFLKLEGEEYSLEQIALVNKLAAKSSETVVVLLANRAAPLPFEGVTKGLIYMPSICGKTMESVTKILCGIVNPSGKLNVSYAINRNDYPANMYKKAEGRGLYAYESVFNGYRYFNSFKRNVMYPFGHGLSYSRFEIYNQKMRVEGDELIINFVVKNVGEVSGGTVVFVFGSLPYDGIFGLKSRLAGFKRVFLDVGENTAVHLAVNLSEFSVYDSANSEWLIPGGKYMIDIGNSATDIKLSQEIKVPKSTRYNLGLGIKEVPTYFTLDGFNPLGQDVEKVMKMPLMARELPITNFTAKADEADKKKLVKLAEKKLSKMFDATEIDTRLNAMSKYALEKLIKIL